MNQPFALNVNGQPARSCMTPRSFACRQDRGWLVFGQCNCIPNRSVRLVQAANWLLISTG